MTINLNSIIFKGKLEGVDILKKKEFNYKIIIGLLVAIIVILIGFFIYFIEESIDEKEEIRHINNTYENNSVNSNNDTSTNATNQNYISRDEVLTIALKDANINQSDIRDIDIELDYKYGQTVYEVNFNYKQYEYEYYINAENGNIVKSFRERD